MSARLFSQSGWEDRRKSRSDLLTYGDCRRLTFTCFAVLVIACFMTSALPAAEPRKPNVVLIVADDK